jgi:hypothetical protein
MRDMSVMGNGTVTDHTDFLISVVTLYACWEGEYWVIMLPSEY